jgi:hypothetical protein
MKVFDKDGSGSLDFAEMVVMFCKSEAFKFKVIAAPILCIPAAAYHQRRFAGIGGGESAGAGHARGGESATWVTSHQPSTALSSDKRSSLQEPCSQDGRANTASSDRGAYFFRLLSSRRH